MSARRSRAPLLPLALLLSAAPVAAHPAMSQVEMARMLGSWYAIHRESSQAAIPADAAVDTIIAGAYDRAQFDADHDPDTYVDTLTIYQGEVVLWKWHFGAHSTTSGKPEDPQAGLLWDHGLTSTEPEFSRPFNDVGDFPFFCAVDQTIMRGTVRVVPAVSALPASGRIGFLANPFPNPSTGDMSFRVGLREAGRARAEVWDARGRLIATLLDDVMAAGSHPVSWNGETKGGARARAGVYFVSVRLPGFEGRRRFVLDR